MPKRAHSSGRTSGHKRVKFTRAAPGSTRQSVTTTGATKSMGMISKSRRPAKLGGSVKTRVARIENNLLLDVDRKFALEVNETHNNVTTTNPGELLLNGLVQGTTQRQRVGQYINLGKGHCSLLCKIDNALAGTTKGNHHLRCIVLLQKNCVDGGAWAYNKLFRSNTPQLHEFFDFNAKPIFQNFRILFDRIYEMKLPSAAWDGTEVDSSDTRVILNFGWDCRNYRARYNNGDAGTVADIEDGAVWFLFMNNLDNADMDLNFDIVQYFTEKKAY